MSWLEYIRENLLKRFLAAALSASLAVISASPAWSIETVSDGAQAAQPQCPFDGIPNSAIPDDRVLVQLPDSSVTPSQGTMGVEGYLLQIPNEHVESLGDLSIKDHAIFFESTKKIVDAVTRAYGSPVLMEHGVTGQSIKHAHLHILPTAEFDKVVAETERLLCDGGPDCAFSKVELEPEDGLLVKKMAKEAKGGYLYLEEPATNRAVLFAVAPDPRHQMILRKAAAAALGRPELADWKKARANPELVEQDEALRQKTIDRLRGKL